MKKWRNPEEANVALTPRHWEVVKYCKKEQNKVALKLSAVWARAAWWTLKSFTSFFQWHH